MDMNWQTMLHEAANASFEKDIEVRSAADNDAYSCVDLPKAKIRELSEKILHLPHQGIVLLFSRYCFRLSPQETEKFFQMKNAKGRFRFYRELLSTSMGLSSEQVISDASLNRACKIAMKDYLRTELKEDAAVSSTGKSRTHIVFRRFGKAVAVAAITITLLFSTAMVTNAKIREKAGGVCRPYIRNGFISRRRSRYYYNKEAHCAEYQLHAERKCIYGISDPHYFCPEPAQEPYQSFQLRR